LKTHALKDRKDDPLLAAKLPKLVKVMDAAALQESVLRYLLHHE